MGMSDFQVAPVVATFRARIKPLMLKKAHDLGEPLNHKQVAEAAGVSLATLSRWYNRDFDRIDADTVMRLMNYFGCTLNELIEVVDDAPTVKTQ
jgi:DNA-binding Xre family transcriptional regulator